MRAVEVRAGHSAPSSTSPLTQPCVRGVTFQPVQLAGRHRNYTAAQHRLTLTEVRRRLLEQTSVFAPEDLIPVPCHPDSLAMGYALKLAGPDGTVRVTPLTSMIPPEVLINGAANTIIFEQDQGIRAHLAHHPTLLAKAALASHPVSPIGTEPSRPTTSVVPAPPGAPHLVPEMWVRRKANSAQEERPSPEKCVTLTEAEAVAERPASPPPHPIRRVPHISLLRCGSAGRQTLHRRTGPLQKNVSP